ncbi:MAG: zinc ribbon domain-containing protein [Planctomycetes bacterium]|nr:zinc ribbon domain-containing protein [Planctomycetota bacterium]
MSCPFCGKENLDGASFCAHCGKGIKKSVQSVPPAIAQAVVLPPAVPAAVVLSRGIPSAVPLAHGAAPEGSSRAIVVAVSVALASVVLLGGGWLISRGILGLPPNE